MIDNECRTSRTIRLADIKRMRISGPQVALFEVLFGEEVTPTLDLCLKHAHAFNWGCASRNLFTPRQLAAYEDAIRGDQLVYGDAREAAWAVFRSAKDNQWPAFSATVATHSRILEIAKATAFFRVWGEIR